MALRFVPADVSLRWECSKSVVIQQDNLVVTELISNDTKECIIRLLQFSNGVLSINLHGTNIHDGTT